MLKDIIARYRQEFRIWMRQRTKPVTVEEAEEKRFFWAKIYALSSLAFLFVTTRKVYRDQMCVKKESKMPEELAASFVFTSDKPIRVIKYEGLTKVKDVTYSTEELSQFLSQSSKESSTVKDPESL